MKKALLGLTLMAVVFFGLTFLVSMHFAIAQSGTSVNGIISSDTKWTKANSPYTLTGPVALNTGATLTIKPGVTVNLNDYYIQVNSTLSARGSSDNNIIFNSNTHSISDSNNGLIAFNPSSSNWNEQTDSGCIIENAILTVTCIVTNGASPKINNDSLSDAPNVAIAMILESAPIISNNIFTGSGDGILIDDGAAMILNNTFAGNKNGIYVNGDNHASISDNVFSNCNTGVMVWAFTTTLEKNLFSNNQYAIDFSYSNLAGADVRNCTIVNNSVGIRMYPDAGANVIYSNIEGNGWSIYLDGVPSNINIPYNWWGTNDTQTINQTIHDSKNDFNLGTVNFVPFLTGPNSQAMPDTNTPAPTPSPTQSQSPAPSLTPMPSIPEFPTWMSVPLLLIASSLTLAGVGRKKRGNSESN